jgi:cell wall-associated NlpC family hydrolase
MFRLSFIAAVAIVATGCASTGAVPRPFPLPGGTPTAPSTPGTEGSVGTAPTRDGYAISSTALAFRGAPYRNGGSDPQQGFDCSGFVQFVYNEHGVKMPRAVRQQFGMGQDVQPNDLEPGDLVFFSTIAPGPSHVGIAVGGDQFIHAPSTSGVVRVENLSSQYWASRFVGARRVN